jgi:heat shock protein HslJ
MGAAGYKPIRPILLAAALLLSACAAVALKPDPTVQLGGRWIVTAINGEPTGGDRSFNLELKDRIGSAQFGCNSGSGSYVVRDGWLVTGDWIITTAGCRTDELAEFERKGFAILSKPLAVTRAGSGVRLRNGIGVIDLAPMPPVTVRDIFGEWMIVSINGVGTPGGSRFRAAFNPREFRAAFGCNTFRGTYWTDGDRLGLSPGGNTEILCEGSDPKAPEVPLMQFEDWGTAILRSRPEVVLRSERAMQLVSAKGNIDLVRAR